MKIVISSTVPQRRNRKEAVDHVDGNKLTKGGGAVVRRVKGKKLRKGAKLQDSREKLNKTLDDSEPVNGQMPEIQSIRMTKI